MKLTGLQIFWIIFTFETGNTVLLALHAAILEAKQDAWISLTIAGASGILVVFIASKLSLLYPKLTFIEYTKKILGKWFGSLAIIIYFIQWYTIISVILIEFADFTNTIMLPSTPIWILILSMLLLVVYVTYGSGIEGIGRCSEVFGVIVLSTMMILILLSIPNIDFHFLLPIFSDSGLLPILKGALTPIGFFGESVIIIMLVSFMANPKEAPVKAILSVGVSSLLVISSAIIVLMTFGPDIASRLKYAAFDGVRIISVMNFIQGLEIIAVLVWVLSVFIKISVYFFITCYGTAQFFKIKDWRKTIGYVAVVAFLLTMVFPKNALFSPEYDKTYWVPYVVPINMTGIPLLLWIIGSIRSKRVQAKNE